MSKVGVEPPPHVLHDITDHLTASRALFHGVLTHQTNMAHGL